MRCLALNASFEPLTMVPLRRALRLVIEGKAEIVESDGLDLVRIGRPLRPEFAAWRYAGEFFSRRNRSYAHAGATVVGAVGLSAAIGVALGPAAAFWGWG